MAGTATRALLPAPQPVRQPVAPPRTTAPAQPSRTTRTPAAVSRRLGPAVRLGTRPGTAHVRAGGQPLAPGVRTALEDSLQVDMQEVRVHSDSRAQDAARDLSSRAFTHGNNVVLGQGESAADLPLMAHEAAHIVQQQGEPVIQHFTPSGGNSYEREANRASEAVVRGEAFQVQQRTQPTVQRLGIKDVLDKFAELANLIPGFRMFTIVLGINPINMSSVPRTAANVLRALVELIPFGGLISQALDNYGIFDKIGNWVDQQISSLGMTGSAIKAALTEFIDSLHFSDIFDLGGVWDRAKRIFTEPIRQIIDFASGLVSGIIDFIKDAILLPLAKLAEGTDGWNLLIAVLGKNPITGEAVPQTADNLIGPFMKLIGQDEVWQNIKKANALARCWAWFKGALSDVMGFVEQIPSLFISTLKSLEITDIVLLPRAFVKVATVFGGFVGKFFSWAGNAVWDLLKIIFEVVAPGAMPYLKKVGGALKKIFKDPISFVGNLVKAGKLGFQNFANNIGNHLKAAFLDWLTGSLPGVYIPKSLTLIEFGKLALSVLGITWANIRQKLVKATSENIVKGLEVGFTIVKKLVTEGPAAAWEEIKSQLSNLKDMVMQGIMDYIVETVVKKAVAKVLSLLVPGGAFIQAIISIYDTIMVFIAKLSKIIQVAMAFLDSIMAIANGAIGGAAAKVESVLAGLLSLAISFLAGFLGLGKIADKVMNIINTKVRAPVDKAIDFVINWIVTTAKNLFKALFGKKDKDDPEKTAKIQSGLAQLHSEGLKFAQQKSVAKQDAEQVARSVKSKNPVFVSISVIAGEETWDYVYTASPPKKEKGDIPREKVEVRVADLSATEAVKTGSWDVNFFAMAKGQKLHWGYAHVPLEPGSELPPPKPDHSMYINNLITTLEGKPIKLQLIDGSFTDYALRQSIELYEKRFGELKELRGDLRERNLANFQKEFAIRRKADMDNEPAAQGAIAVISFGEKRIALGYKTFEVQRSGEKIIDIPGVGPSYVPTRVLIVAKK